MGGIFLHREIRHDGAEWVGVGSSADPTRLSTVPILYILFNAGLIANMVDEEQGGLGFVDDCTRWVVSSSIDQNMETLQSDARYLGRPTPMFIQRLVVPTERYAAEVITNCFRTVSHEAACAKAGIILTTPRLERKL